ncbi:alpha/beta fold hydrolase [Amycolatopsis jiangsuensis]|uniref:Pimeloyl-ACP methyl ester carboxylesterase n=1 Tax=Amycolatopsis jiangsuensis TaxID=1181879 RepID=A0A840IZQ3_9PSEU|nr:alpha/beta hydrolase [Amycolatopsis jiangsuensis]MBB4688341.1 pimeloyl-ACP methyl ester carboxylesterase [Amycolatopsis jiangsuensis]
MNRMVRATVAVLCCAVAGAGLAACDDEDDAMADAPVSVGSEAPRTEHAPLTGDTKIKVGDRSVHVSCSGEAKPGAPVIMLLHGGGDGLDKMAGFQRTLSEKNRVCSYDRLGAGTSDQPSGPQTMETSGEVLTSVIDQVAGDAPVVLAGHSLGGLFAGRYAPEHQDRVKGVVLMDATSPVQAADLTRLIPQNATGDAAQLRDQTLAMLGGQNPEQLATKDGEVRSAGDIPVAVIQHGQQYLAAIPQYGPALEQAWSDGAKKWLGLSSRSTLSTAAKSGHYIYLDEPAVAVEEIQRVVASVTA